MLFRILIASVLLIAVAFSPVTGPLRLVLFLIPYFIVGYDILLKAAKGISNGRIFDENLRARISKESLRLAHTTFDIDVINHQICDVYKNLSK